MTLSRRSSWALAVCGLVVAVGALSVSARSSSSDKSCEALRQWAQPFAGTQPTLDMVALFDRPHRLAVFNAVTPSTRAALWRDQLERFRGSASLSTAQRDAVAQAIALITPEMYAGSRGAAAALKAHWNRVGGLFTREQRAAWFELGSIVRPGAAPRASGDDWCECAEAYGWYECASGSCASGGCRYWFGCGVNGGDWCEGICTAAK